MPNVSQIKEHKLRGFYSTFFSIVPPEEHRVKARGNFETPMPGDVIEAAYFPTGSRQVLGLVLYVANDYAGVLWG